MAEGCKTCKEKGPGKFQVGVIVIGFYMLSTSIYGTIVLVKNIINFFN
jgi:hypothetical protein